MALCYNFRIATAFVKGTQKAPSAGRHSGRGLFDWLNHVYRFSASNYNTIVQILP
jgi:hypothetical protein